MKVRIHFKDLEASELAKDVILERLSFAGTRFPELERHQISATLSMENSPQHPGPDVFGVKLFISGSKYRNVILEKKSNSLYLSAALVQEALLERLNRFSDKSRVKNRRKNIHVRSSRSL